MPSDDSAGHRAETDEAGSRPRKRWDSDREAPITLALYNPSADDERCRRGANARSTMNDPFGDPLCFVDETSLFTAWPIE